MRQEKLNLFFCILFLSTGLISQNSFADSMSVLKDAVQKNQQIFSIDAYIEQTIKNPENSIEFFKGRYRVKEDGKFRIDYTVPYKQQVLHTGKDVYWYYIDDNVLYKIKSNNGLNLKPKYNPLSELKKIINKNISIEYTGKHIYGFFNIAHNFIIKNKKDDLIFDIWIDAKRKVVLAKIVKNSNDYEIIKELYQDYIKISGIYFPTRVDVFVRTENGILRNTTVYKKIKINKTLSNIVFQYSFPANAKIKIINK